MHIIMMGVARIGDDQGHYVLLANGGHPKHGEKVVLSPVGGALRYRPVGRTHLTALGATGFEGDLEVPAVPILRFRAPDSKVEGIVTWFKQRGERDLTVHNQMTDRLVQDAQVLRVDHLRGYRGGYGGFFRYNVPGKAVYLIETSDVVLGERAMILLKAAARAPISRRLVHFVTAAEIEAGVSRDGIEISPISRYVI